MNSNSYHFEIFPDGMAQKVEVRRYDIDLTAEVAESLAAGRFIKIPNLFPTRWGNAGVAIADAKNVYWTFAMASLPLKAPFRAINGVVVPNFGGSNDPVIALEWKVPSDMKLRALVWTSIHGTYHFIVSRAWLFAFDTYESTYRLPLGNLYDECRLCLGQATISGTNHLDAAINGMNQVQNGVWNADLWSTVNETQKLFRFKPTNDSFSQEEPLTHWPALCTKVGNAIIDKITH